MLNNDWMMPVTTKSGKTVLAYPHIATFNGKHNRSKSKVFIVLIRKKRLSLSELAKASGVSYNYLSSRVSKWVEWGYLRRVSLLANNGRDMLVYYYSATARARRFVSTRIPPARFKAYLAELDALIISGGGY